MSMSTIYPTNPIEGAIVYDTRINSHMLYANGGWSILSVAAPADAYRLFLDDERTPAAVKWGNPDGTIRIARSSQEAKDIIKEYGVPSEISFDHDLGGDDTGFLFMWWIIDQNMNGDLSLSNLKCIQVHSANVEGRKKLVGLWDPYCKMQGLNIPVKLIWPKEPK